MDVDSWLAALGRDTDAMAGVAEQGPLDAPVPACPGWSVGDLVYHAGEVLNFWTTIVRDEVRDPEMIDMPARPEPAALAPWFRTVAAEAIRVLSTSNPAEPCWTWSRQNDVAFVIRRMAQELAVHTWDALDAVGRPAAIEAKLASDGVDEFLEHFAGSREHGAADLGGTAHLHCTDVAGEWLVRQDGETLAFTREHAKGSCALRGAASDLLLVLWRRRGLDTVDVIGDSGVTERFIAWTSLN